MKVALSVILVAAVLYAVYWTGRRDEARSLLREMERMDSRLRDSRMR